MPDSWVETPLIPMGQPVTYACPSEGCKASVTAIANGAGHRCPFAKNKWTAFEKQSEETSK